LLSATKEVFSPLMIEHLQSEIFKLKGKEAHASRRSQLTLINFNHRIHTIAVDYKKKINIVRNNVPYEWEFSI
jgi:hypothetical protein